MTEWRPVECFVCRKLIENENEYVMESAGTVGSEYTVSCHFECLLEQQEVVPESEPFM